jgi:hypothetical protein
MTSNTLFGLPAMLSTDQRFQSLYVENQAGWSVCASSKLKVIWPELVKKFYIDSLRIRMKWRPILRRLASSNLMGSVLDFKEIEKEMESSPTLCHGAHVSSGSHFQQL